ncbi:MAG: response regulator [Rectinemataceae bacterium]
MKHTRILVVEDEFMIASQLKTNLIKVGHVVCGIASRGEDAIAMARKEAPDAILMDIRIRGSQDGMAAAKEIRTFLDVPIIFTSGYADHEMRDQALALQPSAYLLKPISIAQIEELLEGDFTAN